MNNAPDVQDKQPLIEAIQADREAAVAFGRSMGGSCRWTDKQVEVVLAGKGDDCGGVQAFARYRVATIEALREPTAKMLKAGFEDYPTIWTAAVTPDDRTGIWQAMLDAAFTQRPA